MLFLLILFMSSFTSLKTSVNFIISNQAPTNVYIKRYIHYYRTTFKNFVPVYSFNIVQYTKIQSKSLYFILKRSMITSIKNTTNSLHVRATTCLFLNALKTPKGLSKDLVDHTIIQNLNEMPQLNPMYLNRTFQLCLNNAFKQKLFSISNLNIVDAMHTKELVKHVDHNSLYNSFVSKQLNITYPTATIIIYQAPSNINHKNLPPDVFNKMVVSRQMTGNTFPDLSIDGVLFDLKITDKIYHNKNHIYYMTITDEAVVDVKQHLFGLIKRIKLLQQHESHQYYHELVHHADKYHKILEGNNPLSAKKEAVIKWGLFIVKTLNQRPKNFTLPIFYLPEQDVNLAELTSIASECPPVPQGKLEYPVIEKLIQALIGNLSPEQSHAIHIATAGSLGHILKHLDQENPC